MRSALIDSSTNVVINVIVADPAVDPAPEGYFLINLPEDSMVAIGWVYDPATGLFSNPNP
jgi:hypothetical protein